MQAVSKRQNIKYDPMCILVTRHMTLCRGTENEHVFAFNRELEEREGALTFLKPACMAAARNHYHQVLTLLTKENYHALGASLLGVVKSGARPTEVQTKLFCAALEPMATAAGASATDYNAAVLRVLSCMMPSVVNTRLGEWQREQMAADAECRGHVTERASHRDIVDFIKTARKTVSRPEGNK